jgi:hypothetical protein
LEIKKRKDPVTQRDWEDSMDSEGRIKDPARVKEMILEGVAIVRISFLSFRECHQKCAALYGSSYLTILLGIPLLRNEKP